MVDWFATRTLNRETRMIRVCTRLGARDKRVLITLSCRIVQMDFDGERVIVDSLFRETTLEIEYRGDVVKRFVCSLVIALRWATWPNGWHRYHSGGAVGETFANAIALTRDQHHIDAEDTHTIGALRYREWHHEDAVLEWVTETMQRRRAWYRHCDGVHSFIDPSTDHRDYALKYDSTTMSYQQKLGAERVELITRRRALCTMCWPCTTLTLA